MVAPAQTTDCDISPDLIAEATRLWCGLLNAPRLYPPKHPARQAVALQTAAALASINPRPVTLGFGPRHMMVNGAEVTHEGAAELSESLHQLGLAQIAFLSPPVPDALDAIAQVIFDARVGAPARELSQAIEAAAPRAVRCITVPDAARNLVTDYSADASGAGGWTAILRSISGLSAGEAGGDSVSQMCARVHSAIESQLAGDLSGPTPQGFDAASLAEAIASSDGPAAQAVRSTVRECFARAPAARLESLLRLDEFVGTATTGRLDALAEVLPMEMMLSTLERASDALRPSDESFMLLAKLASFSVDANGTHRLARIVEHVSAESESDASQWRAAVHELLRSTAGTPSYTPQDYTAVLKRSAASAVTADPALQRAVRDAWSTPLLNKARVTIDLFELTPDAVALSPLILSLHDQIPELASSPDGLAILASAARTFAPRESDESLRVMSSRWRRRLGGRDVRAAVLCATAGERLSQEDAVFLLDHGDGESIASLIRDVVSHPFLTALVARLIASTCRPMADIAAALRPETETSVTALLQLAPVLPSATLMQLSAPLLQECTPQVAARLAAELHERGCVWPLSALTAALSHASPEVNAIALVHARDHEDAQVAPLLASFFCGELGAASGRRGFQFAASAWAGTGPDRRRRLLSLALFLLRTWSPRISRRAWWSFRLMLGSPIHPLAPTSRSTSKGS